MKSYREIADSVFARRDQYVIQQRKKKQAITRATVSVGSVALVSLAGFALLRSDVFRTAPSITDGVTATTTAVQLPDTDSTTTPPTTSASSVTQAVDTTVSDTDSGKTQSPEKTTVPSNTQSPTTTAPNQTKPSKTTVSVTPSTTTPTQGKILIMANEPDTHGIYNTDEGFNYEEPISPLLAQMMEQYSDTDAVYAVLIAINHEVRDSNYYPSDPSIDPVYYNAYHNEFLKTNEIEQLIREKDEAYADYVEAENTLLNTPKPYPDGLYSDYIQKKEKYFKLSGDFNSRVFDFRRELCANVVKQRLQELSTLSETEPIHIPFETGQELYIRAVQIYSFHGEHAYFAVLSAEAIRELAEQGNYMFWLDSPSTSKDINYGTIIDMG